MSPSGFSALMTQVVSPLEKYASSRELGGLGPHGGWLAPDGSLYAGGETWDIPMDMRGNVRFLSGDAKVLPEWFAEKTFDTIYANFSDPWPKAGHAKRRLTHRGFLELYRMILKDGGELILKTDNVGLFDFSVEEIEANVDRFLEEHPEFSVCDVCERVKQVTADGVVFEGVFDQHLQGTGNDAHGETLLRERQVYLKTVQKTLTHDVDI